VGAAATGERLENFLVKAKLTFANFARFHYNLIDNDYQ